MTNTTTPRAVFLDKDGTLIENAPYNPDPARIQLTRGAVEGLQALEAAGYQLAVVSNQAGVALGSFPETALRDVEQRLRALLEGFGVTLSGFFYCPHHPDGLLPQYRRICACRKPAPGLVFHAARQLGVNLERSWLIGDILDDVEAGGRAGCRTIFLDRGHETQWRAGPYRKPTYAAADLESAARLILANEGESP